MKVKLSINSALSDSLLTHLVKERIKGDETVTIVYPYIVRTLSFKLRYLLLNLLALFRVNFIKDPFRFLINEHGIDVIFICHENLDRPYWWNKLGRYLLISDISRITFWPSVFDNKGVRFPYWYNYIDWPGIEHGYGKVRNSELISIDKLMLPIKKVENRVNRIVYIGSHFDFPRDKYLQLLNIDSVDIFGKANGKFIKQKDKLISTYKYNFCPENSLGFGYDTEKLPEAWNSGCIPVCYLRNPFSDFNVKLFDDNGMIKAEACHEQPLLTMKPSLDEVIKYIDAFFLNLRTQHESSK